MKRNIFLLAASAVALGYSHGTTETVTVKPKGGGDPVRVNKDEYDADQELATGERQWGAQVKDAPEPDGTPEPGSTTNATGPTASDVNASGANGVLTTAAPSAPDFSGGGAEPVLTDTLTQAAAPAATTPDQILVLKGTGASGSNTKKGRFYLCDGNGVVFTGDRAKQLGIEEEGYDTEAMAKDVQSRTEPKPPVT